MRMRNSQSIILSIFGLCVLVTCWPAQGQLLLRDDFANSGNLDTTVWRLPFEGEGVFVGRTQFQQTTIPQQGIVEPAASDGKVTEIYLDTYSAIDPGNQFLGTDLLTKRNFARGGGLSFEARMRLKPGTVGGLVNGFFSFDVQRDNPAGSGNFVRDEIDWELISNQLSGANQPFSNFWNDGDFSNGGSGQFHNVSGLNLTEFHDYRVDWSPTSLKWYVDNTLVRTQTTNIPDDPMKVHFNLWAPDSTFAQAFNAALNPVATPGQNQRYTAQIDHVEVNRFNTTTSANLLMDPSFEDFNIINITPTNGGLRNVWLKFENVFIESFDPDGSNPSVPDQAIDGDFMAKMFGPFNGNDASGMLQNVAAAPGEEFEASVFVQTALGDSIAGKQNFNLLSLSFLDGSGNVIQESFGSPTNVVDKNGKNFPLLDGRDTNMPVDQWVQGTVNAVAPAGTASARMSLFFIQLASEGGASWFDAASLVKLTANTPTVSGDFDNNGIYDCADIDALVQVIAAGTDNPAFDLTQDGQVDVADRDAWLAEAGDNNLGAGRAYLLGDANLDSVVDGQDFIAWNTNKFMNLPSWCGGDFTADGVVDGQDFIAWNTNKFQSADAQTSVPEPAGACALIGALLAAVSLRRK